ncbi:hypothetical protein SAMN05880566_12831 [Janthinobacterium sp. TND4EL3]|uniref:gas vesicle accessory protein GvpU n=1 Tax=Janthinobacterium sp. TND4EL3 TaxID=1907311 RepID=UPI0009571727|nr:gas vesicle accessory protein GvpU [Janthinobacterium sp. TND4EL3]SIR85681.1 hypothetical protein SAMN05880566_12831 [Janthinobacterium sp. TND4EL3]
MSDQEDVVGEESITRSFNQPDFVLQNLVAIVNCANGLEVGITLQTGGMLVSGNVIAGDVYFREYAELLIKSTGVTDLTADAVRESYRNLGAKFVKVDAKGDADLDSSENVAYIHLKNAKFVHQSGGNIPTSGGVLWRGRLIEVVGFCLGTISNKN